VQQEKTMSGFRFSPETLTFNSTFAGIPVVIEYEVEINEDHRGRDIGIVPTVCVIGEVGVDLCEDAGYFHPDQLKKWLAQAEADYANLGGGDDFGVPEYYSTTDLEYFAARAEDQFVAERDHAYYAHARL
jgi:hypothetical protein